ncbi:MAG TPA: GatB/YqeY domain-containing protein [Gemmatimonadaceae bacterium]|nr:GatB/YqeY domain-containing protein [Gemmatimonadaceae bacterium]
MAPLLARLQDDLNAARKSHDKPRVLLLGTIISDVKNREIELKRDITDEDAVDVLRRGIKRRRESIEMYEKGGRTDLAATEKAEVEMLSAYLPAGASEVEIRAAVVAAIDAGANNVGAVMGKVMAQFKGRAEGGTINTIVREELAARAGRPT